MLARLLVVASLCLGPPITDVRAAGPRLHDESDPFFANVEIPELRISIEPRQMDRLREAPREYVVGVMTENGAQAYGSVGVKLKGAAGSYRNWEDRPALTINMKKFQKKGEFHGLKKFHLNNSVQDGTYLNELAASYLCLKAGLPAPRITYARVWLNDRDVGLYVLKEGFDELFIKRYFPDFRGNLYEGPFCADIDRDLEKESGDGPDDRSDLKAIIAAGAIGDATARRAATEQIIDVDTMSDFIAMERITCHWDGYTQNRNNYRVYFHHGKACFLPSGMDQMFGNPGQGLFDGSGSLAARLILDDVELKTRYFRRAAAAVAAMPSTEEIAARLDYVHQRLRPVMEKVDKNWPDRHKNETEGMKHRLAERMDFLKRHIAAEKANLPQEFDSQGVARLSSWYPQAGGGSSTQDEPTVNGRKTLHIKANADGSVSSWRTKVLLGKGVYTLTTDARLQDVVAPNDNQSGVGVGLSGTARTQHLTGTLSQPISFEFTVNDDRRQVEFVFELRAKSGDVWFDAESLKLTRKPLP